jgi:NAD(P)-dependent dehydrogenase (short-subunit alcohol dehydrogenase family)
MTIDFEGRVAIVTGAGSGLGRSHALGLAARGANVVVNDFGQNGGFNNAMRVVEEIRAAGGTAIGDNADVADFAEVSEMVARAEKLWGHVDILVNNAGVLRDKTFAKMEMADFEFVVRVHLIGSANCTKAVWAGMRERNYGRIVFTSSASGIYGNFGQANYGAAKAAMIGLMNVLHLEGAKNDIRVNVLAPTARTAMTEGLLTPVAAELMTPESVTPGVLFLVSENAPSRVILGAGAGVFAVTHIGETPGVYLNESERTPETIAARFAEISDSATAEPLKDAFSQTMKFVAAAAKAKGFLWNDDANEPLGAVRFRVSSRQASP